MTSRERLLTALRHKSPDAVPLDIGGTESSGITAVAYHRLREHLAMSTGDIEVFDVYQQVVKIEDDLRTRLRIDTVPLMFEPISWKAHLLPDGSPCRIPSGWTPEPLEDGSQVVRDTEGHVVARMPKGGFYFEPVRPPLAAVADTDGLRRHEDTIAAFDRPAFLDEPMQATGDRARHLAETTDLALVANLQFHLLAAGQILRGYESFMVDLLLNKPLAHALLRRLVHAYKDRVEHFSRYSGRASDVVLVNDDLGTQHGPMLSLDCYREMIWPYQKELFQFIKKKTGAFLLFHSCGSVHEFIPLLIEAGVDALNPVQVSAAGMDTQRLKKEFGRDLTFWGGGCDTQQVLRCGSPAQIRDEVKRRVNDLAADGGGFVFTQVHNIQPDVPSRNVMIMLEAFEACRRTG